MRGVLSAVAVALFAVSGAMHGQGSAAAQATADEPRKLLFLTHAALYKHTSLGPAEKAVTELGKIGGFDVTTVEGYKQDAKQLIFRFSRRSTCPSSTAS